MLPLFPPHTPGCYHHGHYYGHECPYCARPYERPYSPPPPSDELSELRREADALRKRLEEIERRLSR